MFSHLRNVRASKPQPQSKAYTGLQMLDDVKLLRPATVGLNLNFYTRARGHWNPQAPCDVKLVEPSLHPMPQSFGALSVSSSPSSKNLSLCLKSDHSVINSVHFAGLCRLLPGSAGSPAPAKHCRGRVTSGILQGFWESLRLHLARSQEHGLSNVATVKPQLACTT